MLHQCGAKSFTVQNKTNTKRVGRHSTIGRGRAFEILFCIRRTQLYNIPNIIRIIWTEDSAKKLQISSHIHLFPKRNFRTVVQIKESIDVKT